MGVAVTVPFLIEHEPPTRRDFAPDNPNVTKAIHAEVAKAFEEDRHILEEQQKVIHLFVDPENVDITADAGSIQARRVLRQRMKLDTASI
jgi:phenylpropionate dioxygenase-like ring-hydroxylating dioxygenase large terminal subunit